ncbi:SEC-C metal-binding domain-containing protein [Paenibacillus ginsengihumi]|uniref:SEC-C metal-binding domain-containing protein n=1 Tax=Paenibacillus ginsengihumi TaxID=431596 RepID=UPI00146EB4EF|nr:SEC-C metal-binding domain-containing protein [Paenibacillus ginsengihumi]
MKHQQRIDIRSMPNDQLFQEFERYLKESYGKYYNEIDTFYGDQLVRELGRRACLDEAYILHELDSYNPDNDFGYDYIYYSQLAGEMRLESAIPFLCGFLGSDDDLLPAKAADALVRIGTEAVVSAVSEQYVRNRSHEYFGLYASDIFGKIKLPSSEAALLALLPEEDDLTNATNLANGLCEIGSIQGIPLVRQLVESGYDAMHMDLKESLYAHCIIAGQQLPELESWKSDLEEKRQKRRTVPLTLAPLVHSDKIGRNDPCPCGSGKKYKKCCGSNA